MAERVRIGKVVVQEGVYCTGTKLPTMGAACLTMFSTKMKRDSASNSSPAVTWISSICFKISSSSYPFGTPMISNSTAWILVLPCWPYCAIQSKKRPKKLLGFTQNVMFFQIKLWDRWRTGKLRWLVFFVSAFTWPSYNH